MNEIKVAENKTLKLTNVLSRVVQPEELANLPVILTQMQNFMKHNRISVLWKNALLMLTGNKQTWNKILARLKHKPSQSDWTVVNDKYEHILNNQRGDLLSVCVVPEGRGQGYAQGMMEAYLAAMKTHGCKLCLLSVKTDNLRARRYYERNGFELYRTRGEEGLTYMKLL